MQYFGFITVRTTSSRLKKKCLLKFGKINILEHVILRALKNNIIPIVCTSKNKSDDIIQKISKKHNVKFYRGSLRNKINRWKLCAKKYKINFFHTIDADDPFFDSESIKKSLIMCKSKYDIVFPSKVSRSGGASEGYSFSYKSVSKLDKLLALKQKLNKNIDIEMIEKFIDNKNFKVKTLKGNNYEIKNARLTLDYKEDYDMLKIIQNKCGNFASRKKINFFLKKNKNVLDINFFRTFDWQKKQKKLLS